MKDFLFTLLAWLLTLPFIIAAVAFALYNQEIVPVTINPFYDTISLPVYVPVLCAIAFGFIFGAIMTWAAMGRLRAAKREQARRIRTLEKQLEAVNQNEVKPHNYASAPALLIDRIMR